MQISWFLSSAHSGSPSTLSSHSEVSEAVQLLGEEEYKMYRVGVMHISNPEELDERDLVYNTFGDIATATIASTHSSSTHSVPPNSTTGTMNENKGTVDKGNREKAVTAGEWILIPGIGATLSRYPSGSIIWIESTAGGKKSVVHTQDQSIRCTRQVGYFMEEYPGIFLQPSVSFIVNPLYVKNIKRFQIDLWDGKSLRVPEKKYTKFKKEFEEFFDPR